MASLLDNVAMASVHGWDPSRCYYLKIYTELNTNAGDSNKDLIALTEKPDCPWRSHQNQTLTCGGKQSTCL